MAVRKSDNKEYKDLVHFDELIELLEVFGTSLLFQFDKTRGGIREITLKNFIAKSISFTKSISHLFKVNQFGESIILFRALVERYAYIKYLSNSDKFNEFDDWSYTKGFEQRNKARSLPNFSSQLNRDFWKDEKSKIERYQKLKKQKIDWKEPNVESVLKQEGLGFIYTLGYDYGSSFVHPRTDEGHLDYLRLTMLAQYEEPIEFKAVLHNSVLLTSMIMQEALNASKFNWMAICYNFLEEFLKELNGQCSDYKMKFALFGKLLNDNKIMFSNN